MPETASYQRYRSRIEYLEQHLQLVDLALTKLFQTTRPQRHQPVTFLQALNVTSNRYGRLQHPVNHTPRLTNFSRAQNINHALVSLYRYFAEYLRGILGEIYETDPKLVVGKAPQSLQFHEIVDLGTYEAVVERMVTTVFRKLENERSTTKLLDKILAHTGVNLPAAKKDAALPYLEMRHLVIHNHGKADQKFVAQYGQQFQLAVDQSLPGTFRTAAEAIRKVTDLLHEVDRQLIAQSTVQARA